MIGLDGLTRYLPDDPQALKTDIVQTVANGINVVSALKANIQAGIEKQITPAADLAGQISAAALEPVEHALQSACAVERMLTNCITDQIAGQLAAANGLIDLCQGLISKAERKLEKRRLRGTIPPADAQPQGQPVAPPQPAPVSGPEVISAPAGPVPAGPIPSFAGVFPPPPEPAEIASLSIPTADGQGFLPLSQLPAAYWHSDCTEQTFFSLSPTPLTRAAIEVDREIAGERRPYGQIYLNVCMDVPATALAGLADAFGMDQRRVTLLTPLDAYNAAVGIFGPQVVDAVWEVYGIPLPVLPPTAIPPLRSPETAKRLQQIAAENAELNGAPPPPIAFNGMHPVAAPIPGAQPVAAELPQLPGLRDLLPPLELPSLERVCEVMAPLFRYLGVDATKMPPCATMQQLNDYVFRRGQ